MRIFESEAILAVIAVSEALGFFFIDMVIQKMNVTLASVEIRKSIEIIFSNFIILLLYVIFRSIWNKRIMQAVSQYILYFIMFLYSIVNILMIAVIKDKKSPIVLLVVIGGIFFANMYLLYFIGFIDERNYYKFQVEIMHQQENFQNDYCEMQRKKYKEVIAILHDVDKHIKIIENLYEKDLKSEALSYTKQISGILQPLVPFQYTDNPILNCLLEDKIKEAEKLGIVFEIDISDADINFMKPIDITTLFGNLIDNAIIANIGSNEQGYIGLYMKEHSEMLSIRIENSISGLVSIKHGNINYKKGGRKGIGLLNIKHCIHIYEGSILYKQADQLLVCDIILNRIDDPEM